MSGRPGSATSLHALHGTTTTRSTSTPHGVATTHFGELRTPLLRFISDSEVVAGCVAWLTDRQVLDALTHRPSFLLVQKESWWKRTDARGQHLARRYAALNGGLPASAFPEPLATRKFRGKPIPNDTVLAPIACVGYGNGGQYQPLMHHKFVVRAVLGPDGVLVPTAVWMGSANFTSTALDSSVENAIEIHDPTIAAAYLDEFALIASISEPMNWRFNRPTPKGLGTVFVAPPVPPKQTTTHVVSGVGRRKAAAKKTASKDAAQTVTRKTPARKAAVTPIRPSTKKAPSKPSSKPVKKTTARTTARKAS